VGVRGLGLQMPTTLLLDERFLGPRVPSSQFPVPAYQIPVPSFQFPVVGLSGGIDSDISTSDWVHR